MSESFKEQDREKIVAYLAQRELVEVDELMEKCGAEKLRVYALLHELVLEKQLCVVKESEWGAPETVALNK